MAILPHILLILVTTLMALSYSYAYDNIDNAGHDKGKCEAKKVTRLRQTAEQGSASAQNRLGDRYAKGYCVKQDYVEAAKWYLKSAEQGDAEAQFNLAMMYYEGLDVPHDYSEAAKWFSKAAEQGHSKAQYALGSLYITGRGVLKDPVQGYKWIHLSASKDDEHVRDILKTLAKSMTQEQINAAEKEVKDWITAHSKISPAYHK